MPLALQLLENVGVSFGQLTLALFLFLAGVQSLIQQLTGREPLVARFGQNYFRIFAESQCTAQFAVPVIHAPVLGIISIHEKVKSTAIGKFVWLILGLSSAGLNVSEGNSKLWRVTVSV